MGWLATAGGYEVTLDGAAVICRNSAGKQLRSLPKAVRTDPVTEGLVRLAEWLEQHQSRCLAEVESWMTRSLPVPVTAVVELWPDPAWRRALTDLVVAPVTGSDWDPDRIGFLRGATESGIAVVTLDGDTVRLDTEAIAIPHPALLPELDELRDFLAELDLRQPFDQLLRPVHRPDQRNPEATSVPDYAGGEYRQLREVAARASRLGFPIRGGDAVCRIVEGGRVVEARYWIGTGEPDWETETGDLAFTDAGGSRLPLGQVGPVAWSEGIRMASALYAGRAVPAGQGSPA